MLDVISVVDPGYTKTRGQMLSEMNRCPKSQKLGPTFKAVKPKSYDTKVKHPCIRLCIEGQRSPWSKKTLLKTCQDQSCTRRGAYNVLLLNEQCTFVVVIANIDFKLS